MKPCQRRHVGAPILVRGTRNPDRSQALLWYRPLQRIHTQQTHDDLAHDLQVVRRMVAVRATRIFIYVRCQGDATAAYECSDALWCCLTSLIPSTRRLVVDEHDFAYQRGLDAIIWRRKHVPISRCQVQRSYVHACRSHSSLAFPHSLSTPSRPCRRLATKKCRTVGASSCTYSRNRRQRDSDTCIIDILQRC